MKFSIIITNRIQNECHMRVYLILLSIMAYPIFSTGQVFQAYDTTIVINESVSIHFQSIPAGSFYQGSDTSEPNRQKDEGPRHAVHISRGFYLATFEVTQQQWQSIMGSNPAIFSNLPHAKNRPVESVSWQECQDFIGKLNQKNIGTFRLPTEAEWEYACRAGSRSAYYWGEQMAENGSSDYAWANSRSMAMTHPVGQKKPNNWGLYDMSGNVWEWCSDWYGPYPAEEVTDPKGPVDGKMKVFRGGSWYDFFESHRSANRHKHAPDEKYTAIGFRLLLEK